MPLSADYEHHVFYRCVVERLLRRGIDGLGKIDAGNNGADVLFDLRNLHRLRGCLRRYGDHVSAPWNAWSVHAGSTASIRAGEEWATRFLVAGWQHRQRVKVPSSTYPPGCHSSRDLMSSKIVLGNQPNTARGCFAYPFGIRRVGHLREACL